MRVALIMAPVLSMGFALFSVSGSAAAPTRSSCDYDVKRHCPNTSAANRREVTACLKAHEPVLTPACLQYLDFNAAFTKACNNDFKTHCQGTKTDPAGIVGCLKQKKQMLSLDCKKLLERILAPPP